MLVGNVGGGGMSMDMKGSGGGRQSRLAILETPRYVVAVIGQRSTENLLGDECT